MWQWWRTYHPLSISWQIHHTSPLPGESHRSVGRQHNRTVTDGTACLPDGKGTRGKMWCMIWNLHSSLGRWRLCCWGHPGHLLGYSGAAPAGLRLSYYSRSGSRSWQWSPPNWTNQHNRRRSNDCGNTTYQQCFFIKLDVLHHSVNTIQYDSCRMN